MPLLILLIILSAPLVELWLLIEVGGKIGGLATILLCLLTAGLGLQLIRAQGFDLNQRMRAKQQAGEPFGVEMLEAVGLALSGLFLLFPGLISDAIGFLLLIPPLRRLVASRITLQFRFGTMDTMKAGAGDGPIIDGESVPVKTNKAHEDPIQTITQVTKAPEKPDQNTP